MSLLERVGRRLLAPDGAVVSLRELAAAADVSTATLLEDRESLITAYLEHCYRQGTVYTGALVEALVAGLDH